MAIVVSLAIAIPYGYSTLPTPASPVTVTLGGTVTQAISWDSTACSWLGTCSQILQGNVTIAVNDGHMMHLSVGCDYYKAGMHVQVNRTTIFYVPNSVQNQTYSYSLLNEASGC